MTMKQSIFTVALIVTCVAGAPSAQEVVSLTAPITFNSTTGCQLDSLEIHPSIGNVSQGVIVVKLVGTGSSVGQTFTKQYDATTNPTGASLISSLNTANLTANSLIKRVYQRLSTDGVCVGSVTGSPQH